MNVAEEIKQVTISVEQMKASIYQSINKEHSDVFQSKSQQDLLRVVKPLLSKMDKLSDKFEKEVKPKASLANRKHKDLVEEYQSVSEAAAVLERLCKCHTSLAEFWNCNRKEYVRMADYLVAAKSELDYLDIQNCDVKIFKILRNEFVDQKTQLMINIEEAWSKHVTWSYATNASWDSMNGHLKTQLKITNKIDDMDIFTLVKAMERLDVFQQRMKVFSKKLYSYLIKPLLVFPGLAPSTQVGADSKCNIFKIVRRNSKVSKCKIVDSYKGILEIVQFLRNTLFAYYYESIKSESATPLGLIGSNIWNDLSEVLINDQLASNVPNARSQMEQADTSYIQATINFEKDLITQGFIPPDTDVLSKYVKDINVHFANKMCQDILSEARDLMLTEIHNMQTVSLSFDRAVLSISEDKPLDKNVKNMLLGLEQIQDDFISVDVFSFPECQISESVQRLVDLVYSLMVKATESPAQVASKLFYSCRDIFELYVNIVPVYHKENLKLAQLAALHYNNCMYLAHHCTTLGHQFRSSLPGHLQSAMTTFCDFVPVLRRCGTKCFIDQMRDQQQAMIDALASCEGFTNCTTEQGVATIKRAINQIIHLVTRLTKLWWKVLPENVFRKSIATLFDSVLQNIIASIFKMEDISAEEAGQLHSLLNPLLGRSEEVLKAHFEKSETLREKTKSWEKFSLVMQTLEATLQEIVLMWQEGKGELAVHFSDSEVRTLIRALFQNTDRRSAALAKIQNLRAAENVNKQTNK